MAGLGTMMAGGVAGGDRQKARGRQADDFYPTPPEATQVFCRMEYSALKSIGDAGSKIWEPACGDGAMARVLGDFGFDVTATDMVDRGFGVGGVDFLKSTAPRGDAVITNPPFKLAMPFLEAALRLCPRYVAMLLKSTFFHAEKRRAFFYDHPPTVIYPLTWRLDFLGLGRPTMECAWFVWDQERRLGNAAYMPVGRDSSGSQFIINAEQEVLR